MKSISLFLLFLSIFPYCGIDNKTKIKNDDFVYPFEHNYLLDAKGQCPTSKDALIKLAEIHLMNTYGRDVLKERPFTAKLLGDTVWAIAGTLPYEEAYGFPGVNSIIGGVACMYVSKANCEILQTIHGK